MQLAIDSKGTKEVAAALLARAKRLKNLEPPLRVAATDLQTVIADSFRDERSPAGEAWQPLSPVTLLDRALSRGGKRVKMRKARRGYNVGVDLGLSKKALRNISNVKMLRDTARGFNSVNVKASTRGIAIRSDVAYMRAHLGGDTKRTPPHPPRRAWAPVVWAGNRWAYDHRGQGGQWYVSVRNRVARFVISGET